MGKSLLIIGAGGHGKVVKEIALNIKENDVQKYDRVDFLDDHAECAVGKLEKLEEIGKKYDEVFCAIGSNLLRRELIEKIEKYGFNNPVLIHRDAYVSKTAIIGDGTVIEPKAVVNANSIIGNGSILSIGTLVDHDVVIGTCCHINAGVICKAGSRVDDCIKIDAGQIVDGF